MGTFYYVLEGIWRIPKDGYTNLVMLAIRRLCGLAIGSINQISRFYKMKVIYQSLIGAVITLCIEFLSGLILDIWLGLGIWDYSTLPFSLLGKVCLPFGLLWFLIMPLAIWLEDTIRYKLFQEGTYYSLIQIYLEFITFK